jgi:hypothetical protein
MKNLNKNIYSKSRLLGFITLITLVTFGLFSQKVYSQTPYKIVTTSHIKVLGTSNLHDWDMNAESFTCEGNFIVKGGVLKDISSLSFVLPVVNLKSKESLMDKRAYKALKSDEFSKITFKLTEATVNNAQKTIAVTGNLNIAGVTHLIKLQSTYMVNADESITCKGSKAIKMSDYNIKAPSFMLGALKTGDPITIEILLKLKK